MPVALVDVDPRPGPTPHRPTDQFVAPLLRAIARPAPHRRTEVAEHREDLGEPGRGVHGDLTGVRVAVERVGHGGRGARVEPLVGVAQRQQTVVDPVLGGVREVGGVDGGGDPAGQPDSLGIPRVHHQSVVGSGEEPVELTPLGVALHGEVGDEGVRAEHLVEHAADAVGLRVVQVHPDGAGLGEEPARHHQSVLDVSQPPVSRHVVVVSVEAATTVVRRVEVHQLGRARGPEAELAQNVTDLGDPRPVAAQDGAGHPPAGIPDQSRDLRRRPVLSRDLGLAPPGPGDRESRWRPRGSRVRESVRRNAVP